jgi:hypothetical protein
MAGVKLRESFAHIPAPHLIQDVAHAKSWCVEHVISYIDGEEIVFIRHLKYAVDVIRMLQLFAQMVSTLEFVLALLQKEVSLANAYANEGLLLVAFGRQSLSPAGLRTAAEQAVDSVLSFAANSISQQISETTQAVACLF